MVLEAINNKEFKSLLGCMRKCNGKTNNSVLILGPTGVGKTETIKTEALEYAHKIKREFIEWNNIPEAEKLRIYEDKVAREKYHILMDLRVSIMDPTDLAGLPNQKNMQYTDWIPPLVFKVLGQEGVSATVFFDEFNQSTKMVQNASFSIILDKFVGNVKFQPDVFVVAAGNESCDGGHVVEMSAPLKNRFAIKRYDVTLEEWALWMIKQPDINMDVVGTVRFKEEYLHSYKKDTKAHAFTTPRSLFELARIIHENELEKDLDTMQLVAEAKCGPMFAADLISFKKVRAHINLDDLLKNPSKAGELKGIDLKHALLSSAIERFRKNQKDKKLFEGLIEIASELQTNSKRSSEHDTEFAIFFLKAMRQCSDDVPLFRSMLTEHPLWRKKLSKEYSELLID